MLSTGVSLDARSHAGKAVDCRGVSPRPECPLSTHSIHSPPTGARAVERPLTSQGGHSATAKPRKLPPPSSHGSIVSGRSREGERPPVTATGGVNVQNNFACL
jgi:hypothetical protein